MGKGRLQTDRLLTVLLSYLLVVGPDNYVRLQIREIECDLVVDRFVFSSLLHD